MVETLDLTYTGAAVSALPNEVAAVLSFESSDPVPPTYNSGRSGVRGRWYLGPLGAIAVDDVAGQAPRIEQAFLGQVIGAWSGFFDTMVAATAPPRIWSRKLEALLPITKAWMDNDFDTQRRRQVDANYRETWFL